jgi:GT2 family glycosyltransferase
MRLSVVILNYNVRYFLEQCLDSVQKALERVDGEIIVVDNASPDDSVEMVRSRFPDVKLITNSDNAGFPKGNNIGVALAAGTYVCILNPDTVVAEDTFEKALAFAEAHKDAGIIGVKLIDGTGKFLPEAKRGIPTPFVAFTKVAGLYKVSNRFGKYYAQHLSEDQTGKVDILVGAFMLLKRDFYNELKGFDEDCFMYSDDIDLSYRALLLGKSNYYFHGTSVIHYKGESTVRDRKYMDRFREAMGYFYQKHFRQSLFFDFLMKGGAYFFALAKKNKSVMEVEVGRYSLVSDDDSLRESIAEATGKPVTKIGVADVAAHPKTEIVFDAKHVGYKWIISEMERLKASGATFKIAHPGEGFMIGSNSSDGRGEVVTFATRR